MAAIINPAEVGSQAPDPLHEALVLSAERFIQSMDGEGRSTDPGIRDLLLIAGYFDRKRDEGVASAIHRGLDEAGSRMVTESPDYPREHHRLNEDRGGGSPMAVRRARMLVCQSTLVLAEDGCPVTLIDLRTNSTYGEEPDRCRRLARAITDQTITFPY